MKAYGALELTDSSPAQSITEPLTTAQVATWLGMNADQQAVEEDLLSSLITGARELAEIHQKRDIVRKQYDLSLDLLLGYEGLAGAAYPLRFNSLYNFGIGYEINLRAPLVSVDLFQYTDYQGNVTALVENADYYVDKARSLVTPPWNKTWPFFTPQVSSAVLVRFTSGYSSTHPFWKDAGQRVLQGMRLLITDWHEGRYPQGEIPEKIIQILSYGARPGVF